MGVTTSQTQCSRQVHAGRGHRTDVRVSAYARTCDPRRDVSQRIRTFQAQYVVNRSDEINIVPVNEMIHVPIVCVGSKSHLRRTAKKHPVSRKTVQKFHESTVWQMENELYVFVAREFAFAYAKQFPNAPVGRRAGMERYLKSGGHMPPPSFRFEKIYPKASSAQPKKKKGAGHA